VTVSALGGVGADAGSEVFGEDARRDVFGTLFGLAYMERSDQPADEAGLERVSREERKKLETAAAFLGKAPTGVYMIFARLRDVIEDHQERTATTQELELVAGPPMRSISDARTASATLSKMWRARAVMLEEVETEVRAMVAACGWDTVQGALQERRQAVKNKLVHAHTEWSRVPGGKCKALAFLYEASPGRAMAKEAAAPATPGEKGATALEKKIDRMETKMAGADGTVAVAAGHRPSTGHQVGGVGGDGGAVSALPPAPVAPAAGVERAAIIVAAAEAVRGVDGAGRGGSY
jgi:hypothetical protein